MSSRRARFWPWGRAAAREPVPDSSIPPADDELSAALRALHLAYSGPVPQVPVTGVPVAIAENPTNPPLT